MQLPEDTVVDGWINASSEEFARPVSVGAIELLDELYARDDAVGARLAGEHVSEFEDASIIRESATVLARDLLRNLRGRLG